MVDDGLYYNQKRGILILDVLHAQHDIALKARRRCLSEGAILTAVDSFEVPIFGKVAIYRNCQSYHRTTTNAHRQRSKTRGIRCHRLRKHPRRKCSKHYSRLC